VRSREKALLVAGLARDKKAEDIVVLDMRKISSMTDFFILSSASSAKRAQAISDNIRQGLVISGQVPPRIEGYREARWVLIDAYDVVAHIFDSRTRAFYKLEGLWGDAPKVRLCQKKRKKLSSIKISKKK